MTPEKRQQAKMPAHLTRGNTIKEYPAPCMFWVHAYKIAVDSDGYIWIDASAQPTQDVEPGKAVQVIKTKNGEISVSLYGETYYAGWTAGPLPEGEFLPVKNMEILIG